MTHIDSKHHVANRNVSDGTPLILAPKPAEDFNTFDLDREDKGESPFPVLLQIPLEIRLQILQYVFDLDHLRICPHDDRQMVVLARRIVERKGHLGTKNFRHGPMLWSTHSVNRYDPLPTLRPNIVEASLAALFINHQIQDELSEALVVYLEHCFTYLESYKQIPYADPHGISQILSSFNSHIWHCLSQIGFSVNQEPLHLPRLERAAIERFKVGFSWLNSHMPNLQTVYLNLFCGHSGRPSNSFLAHLIKSVKQLRGQKIITVHGTNRSKKTIAKQWRHYIKDDNTMYILGGCHCHAFASVDHDYVHDWGRGPPSQADTLKTWFTDWTEEKAELAVEGAPMVRVKPSCRGPLIGCLLCQVGTHCTHNRKYDLHRITPTLLPSGQPLYFDDGTRVPMAKSRGKGLYVSPGARHSKTQLHGPPTEEEKKYLENAIDWQESHESLRRKGNQSWYSEEERAEYITSRQH